ncbi:MAG: SurA N-terminal domain-containing protein [Candidatus Bipolaricaulaceae bacterium]
MRSLSIVVLALGLTFCGLAQQAESPPATPVAVVNGEEISRQELNQATNLSQIIFNIYQSFPSFAQTLLTTEEGEALLRRYERDVLDRIVLRRLQLQQARARGIEPDPDRVDERTQQTMDRILEQNDLTQEQLTEVLAQQGRTVENFRADVARQVREQLQLEELRDRVTEQATVSDQEIQDYYAAHPDRFTDDAGKQQPLEEGRDEITSVLLDDKKSQLWEEWLEQIREEAEVTVNL